MSKLGPAISWHYFPINSRIFASQRAKERMRGREGEREREREREREKEKVNNFSVSLLLLLIRSQLESERNFEHFSAQQEEENF